MTRDGAQAVTGAIRVALTKLDDGQGRIARRNARSRFKAAVRRLQNIVDEQYPPTRLPRKSSTYGMNKRQIAHRAVKRMFDSGWVRLSSTIWSSSLLTLLGVRTRVVAGSLWAPRWIACTREEKVLRMMARDRYFRDAEVARVLLNKSTTP